MPSDMAYRKAFGSWGEALKECGYEVAKPFPSEKCRKAAGDAKRGKRGSQASNWKGGRYKNKEGYILIWDSEKKRYVPEHRAFMEQYLGRKLSKEEDVHHKNGIKDDNRIDNLAVVNKSLHTLIHEQENPNKHIRKESKKCAFPECETLTSSKYGLCAKHYKAQWGRLKNGTIDNFLDFSSTERKHTEETKALLRDIALKQKRSGGRFAK